MNFTRGSCHERLLLRPGDVLLLEGEARWAAAMTLGFQAFERVTILPAGIHNQGTPAVNNCKGPMCKGMPIFLI